MFRKPGYFIGDTWYFVQEDRVHMYYLVCPQTVKRHTKWSIAHAVSTNLVDWEDYGVVLNPGKQNTWDNLCLATGSVIEHEGKFFMAYTGNFAGPKPAVGMAVSQDLHSWKKLPNNPVTGIDDILYTSTPNQAWRQPRWRDPFLFKEQGRIYQLICAAQEGAASGLTGTVGLAVTTDMENWELAPPLDVPAIAQDLECPKLTKIGSKYFLTVSISEPIAGDQIRTGQPDGLSLDTAYTFVAKSFMGPYSIYGSGRILGSNSWGEPYACEPVFFNGRYYLLGTVWNDDRPDEVCDPIPIRATPTGFKAE